MVIFELTTDTLLSLTHSQQDPDFFKETLFRQRAGIHINNANVLPFAVLPPTETKLTHGE